MKINRKGSAAWSGGIKDGKGSITTESGALKAYPYGFSSRFEGKPGTNPEELIGAAHAGCFTMALSLILGEANLTAESMETQATVSLEQVEGGYAITAVHLNLTAKIPGADQATVRGTGGEGESRLSGFQADEGRDHAGDQAAELSGARDAPAGGAAAMTPFHKETSSCRPRIPIVIVAAARTPLGRFQGELAGITAPELGAHAIRSAVERAGITADKVEKC